MNHTWWNPRRFKKILCSWNALAVTWIKPGTHEKDIISGVGFCCTRKQFNIGDLVVSKDKRNTSFGSLHYGCQANGGCPDGPKSLLLFELGVVHRRRIMRKMKTTRAITRSVWISPPPMWKAKNPNAHAITSMIRIVSSISVTSFPECRETQPRVSSLGCRGVRRRSELQCRRSIQNQCRGTSRPWAPLRGRPRQERPQWEA